MLAVPRRLQIYVTQQGKRPFQVWMDGLKDVDAQGRILARLERVRLGLIGDCKALGDGVFELRIDTGPGYRVYFAEQGRSLIILLCGGNKAKQAKDIANAKAYWKDYKTRSA